MPSIQIKAESLLWALSALSQFSRMPFDSTLIRQRFAPPHTRQTVHESAASRALLLDDPKVTPIAASCPAETTQGTRLRRAAGGFRR